MTHLTKADAQTGAMVALYPSPATALMLAQAGGEPAEELHVTLAFLGSAADVGDLERLQRAVGGFAATVAPLSGVISGTGTFTAGPEPVTYASVDLSGLPEVRERLVQALCGAGCEPSTEHGFTPHITLAYDARDVQVPNLPLVFDAITVAVAGQRWSFPLAGVAKAEWDVPIWKADGTGTGEDPMIVYGVVLQPGVVDSQGDVVSAAEIEKAAHRFLIESRKHDLQHDGQASDGVVPVESYVAPAELEVAGRRVLKGSWVMGVAIYPDEIKKAVREDRYTGFSIGGSGVRV